MCTAATVVATSLPVRILPEKASGGTRLNAESQVAKKAAAVAVAPVGVAGSHVTHKLKYLLSPATILDPIIAYLRYTKYEIYSQIRNMSL